MASQVLNLRLRWRGGMQKLDGLTPSSTVMLLTQMIASISSVDANRQKLLIGYPPKEIKATSVEQVLSAVPIPNGETIILEEVSSSGFLPNGTVQPTTASSMPVPAPVAVPVTTPSKQPPTQSTPPRTNDKPASNPVPTNPSAIQAYGNDDEGYIVRRIVNADNSCLFVSLSYVLEGHDRSKGYVLRKVVADAIRNDPVEYNDAILGKSNEEYAKWILDKDSWGGEIELLILSKHFQTEIAVVSIDELRTYMYGEGSGYSQRVLLIYDNIHYDPLALAFQKNLPEEMDVTIFETNNDSVTQQAKKLAEDLHKKSQFTNVNKFSLLCITCRQGLVGQKEATEHAKATGHTNFSEYK